MTQSEFEEKIIEFQNIEPMRPQLYNMSLELIQSNYEVDAYLLVLSIWNNAYFRYVIKKFDLHRFRETINNINPIFARLNNKYLLRTELEEISFDIKEIYSQLKPLVKQTGASKIMHFKQPHLFVMWDTEIRSYYHISQKCAADDYLHFLKLMKDTFHHIEWTREDKTLAKAIDEYNYVVVHN